MYSAGATYSTDPPKSSGRCASSMRRPLASSAQKYSTGTSFTIAHTLQVKRLRRGVGGVGAWLVGARLRMNDQARAERRAPPRWRPPSAASPPAVLPGHEGVHVRAAALAADDGGALLRHRHLAARLGEGVHHRAVRQLPARLERLGRAGGGRGGGLHEVASEAALGCCLSTSAAAGLGCPRARARPLNTTPLCLPGSWALPLTSCAQTRGGSCTESRAGVAPPACPPALAYRQGEGRLRGWGRRRRARPALLEHPGPATATRTHPAWLAAQGGRGGQSVEST